MNHWYILSMIGKDRPGIVARLSAALCQTGGNLGDSSMARLGDLFTLMMVVEHPEDEETFKKTVVEVAEEMELRFHLDRMDSFHHNPVEPDVRISIYAEDRPGIVEDVTTALSAAGLNLTHLDSNIGRGEGEKPTYYVHLEGTVSKGIEPLYDALDRLSNEKNMTAQLIPINPAIR